MSTNQGAIRIWNVETGIQTGAIVNLGAERQLFIDASGHYRGPPDIEDDLVYVVSTADGQATLSPAEFAATYHWENDPERVQLLR